MTHLRHINVKGLTFSFIAVSKQPLGVWGEMPFSCLSGCHLCFNLLLYFSKTNRRTLSCLFMLHFPSSRVSPPSFLHLCALHEGILSLRFPSYIKTASRMGWDAAVHNHGLQPFGLNCCFSGLALSLSLGHDCDVSVAEAWRPVTEEIAFAPFP